MDKPTYRRFAEIRGTSATSWWETDGPKSFYVEACDTYIEAVRHAVMALKENNNATK